MRESFCPDGARRDVIEQAMVFALGFLAASLIALAAAPAFWRRAIRLSTRRLEMQLPLSPEEILAGRDLLRAEFAVERRRLEQKAEALNLVHAADMTELGRRAAIIAGQDADLLALSQQDSARSAELAALQRALAETSAELAATAKECYDTSGLIARKDVQITVLAASFEEAQALAANQQGRASRRGAFDLAASASSRPSHAQNRGGQGRGSRRGFGSRCQTGKELDPAPHAASRNGPRRRGGLSRKNRAAA